MDRQIYSYEFSDNVPLDEVEATLIVSLAAIEALHGETQVQLVAPHYLDVDARTCVVDASTDIGRDLSRLLLGFLRREFGPDSFRLRRITTEAVPGATAA